MNVIVFDLLLHHGLRPLTHYNTIIVVLIYELNLNKKIKVVIDIETKTKKKLFNMIEQITGNQQFDRFFMENKVEIIK